MTFQGHQLTNPLAYYNPPSDEASESPGKCGEGGEEEEQMEGETTLIPKSMFAGKSVKPGDQFYFDVVHVYDDEIEVKYGTGGGKEKGSARERMHKSMEKYAEPAGGEEE
jgi:hypothetical protein